MSSVYVVCWIFLQTFQTYFCIQANSVDPDQTAPRGAVWSGSTLFAKMTFKMTKTLFAKMTFKMTKQTTIVVTGALRVKSTNYQTTMKKQMMLWCFTPLSLTLKSYRDHEWVIIYGSNMVFHTLTFARSRWRCWKLWPEAAVFNTSQGTWRMLMHWKNMFDRYYCIKTENICYVSRYFLHYFVSPFHRCLANAISTDYARSRAGQYTSRDGSNSVAPVRTYWKLLSRALTARELPR